MQCILRSVARFTEILVPLKTLHLPLEYLVTSHVRKLGQIFIVLISVKFLGHFKIVVKVAHRYSVPWAKTKMCESSHILVGRRTKTHPFSPPGQKRNITGGRSHLLYECNLEPDASMQEVPYFQHRRNIFHFTLVSENQEGRRVPYLGST